VIDDVGEPAFEASHRFAGCLPGGNFAVVVGAAFAAAVAELDDGHDVQDAVDLPVPCAGEAVADLLARRTRRSAQCRVRRKDSCEQLISLAAYGHPPPRVHPMLIVLRYCLR
jgi:hypothetical protein